VNGSAGEGPERRVTLDPGAAFEIRMELPPGESGEAPFALYAWSRVPYRGSMESLPYDLGLACLPTPLGPSFLEPSVIWNNTGRVKLGEATKGSRPAPSLVGRKPAGHGMSGSFFLQGIIVDGASPSGLAAVTNGIQVELR
jgi:hypothetical protein